ncbi:MAG: peroxidase family protein [Ktedonobacteraceae bacterium]
MAESPFSRFYVWLSEQADWRFKWHKLPLLLSLLDLIGLRIQLRAKNLYDTYNGPKDRPAVGGEKPRYLTARTADGTYNDLTVPTMGSVNTRFGRNVPLSDVFPPSDKEVLTPNPRTVSCDLLRRDSFQPVTILNLLAAAWIQFMVHDWFSHGKNQKENPWQVPLNDDDPWPEHPMTILRTNADSTRSANSSGLPPTYLNTATHWWDGSQIYGSDEATVAKMRSGVDGKLVLGTDGFLPIDPTTGTEIAGVSGNWWIGLSMLHHLFTREHNAICDQLKAAYPSWSDDELFDHARLANAALMAKIHTVDWTTAILAHPALQIGMRANWWGLETERIYKSLGRISKSEVISGIPGSETDHFGVPFSLTEEFVSVYRMHPLMPDDFSFRSVQDNTVLQERTLPEVIANHAREVLEQVSLTDLFYSFGTSYPGAISLHNYPRHLQHLIEVDGTLNDLATTEIIRDRERGVPRYNEFRKLVHRTPVQSFEELTDNPKWAEELRRVYNNDIDQVDLMVGMYAEPKPAGFGFSDTAFRIFILMASRRLNSDRFFTVDYNPKVYSQVGFDWVVNNNMTTVLLRHFPGLAASLRGVDNPFAPWPKAM